MRRPPRRWASMKVENLLDVRLCDLGLKIEGTVLEKRIARLHRELEAKDIVFRPYFWLSDEWFTPDGFTGSAIPFYLAHPRLRRLERSQMGEVEGGSAAWCMKILRHEAGHALDHAYHLHRRRPWQRLFGLSSSRYPRVYRPNPYSRRHVQHLEYWYAQSHPDEDFAETFAVWLSGRAAWRRRYRDWPALRKLEYVDDLMTEIAGKRPRTRTRAHYHPLSQLRKTLREHYAERKTARGYEYPDSYDRELARLFSNEPRHRQRELASAFIRRARPELAAAILPWAGGHRYIMDHVLKEMMGRCRELRLHLCRSERETRRALIVLVTRYTVDSIYKNRRWIEL